MQQKVSTSLYTAATVLVTFIWGFGFITTVEALAAGYTESFIMLFRFIIATLFFGFLCRKQIKDITTSELRGGVIGGTLLFLGFALQTFALPLTTPSNNAILTAANIVLVPFFVWIIFKQKPPTKMFIGAFICFVGVAVLSVDINNLSAFNLGDVLTILCAISFALHTASMGYFAVVGRPSILNFIQMSVAAFMSIILFLVKDRNFSQFIPRKSMVWVLYLALFSTIIAYLIQTSALKHISASRVAIITAAESLVASVISLLIGYEEISKSLVVGGFLVFCSILIVEINPNRKRVKQKG